MRFLGYQTARLAKGWVPNRPSCHEKIPNLAFCPKERRRVPNFAFCQQIRAVGYQTSRFASKCVIWGVRARVLSIVHRSFIMIVQYAILPKEYRREVLR